MIIVCKFLKHSRLWLALTLLLVMGSPVIADGGGSQPTYSFGVVPQFDIRQTVKIWRPILNELERRTGFHFRLTGSLSIPEFEKEFLSGKHDLCYMNPYQIVKASKQVGYEPLLRDTGKKLHGIIVVHKDNPIQKLTELEGKDMVFPAPNALGASLLPRADLHNNYHVTIKPRYVNTHNSVYLNVALKLADAGGGVQKTLNQQPENIRNALRVIYRTEKFAPHPVATHPRVPAEHREKIMNALLAMAETSEGKKLFSRVPINHLGPASIEDYLPIANMGLEAFYQD